MDGRALFSQMQLHAPFRRTPVEPSGELTTLQRGVRPHVAKLLPPAVPVEGGLTFGDQWPESRIIYDYVLGYKFSLSTSLKVSVRFPSLCCQLYESPWEAQLWAIFDSNKRLVVHGDYYAEPTKLPQGVDACTGTLFKMSWHRCCPKPQRPASNSMPIISRATATATTASSSGARAWT